MSEPKLPFFNGNLVAVVAILCAVYLLVEGLSGWGWLIFLAFCSVSHVKITREDGGKNDGE